MLDVVVSDEPDVLPEALGRVPAVGLPLGGHLDAVQEHLGILGGPVQNQAHLLARPGGVGEDGPAVAADGLVHLLPGALPGQEPHRVREPHRFAGDLPPEERVGAGEGKLPIVVQGDVTAHRW